MLTIINDASNNVSFTYTKDTPIVKGRATEEFIEELYQTIDSVLRQAKEKITGVDEETAWDMLYKYTRKEATVLPEDGEQRKMSFNYFIKYADYIVPGIIREIEEKYGKDRLVDTITKGDLAASAQEKVLDCAWMYMNAMDQKDEDLMFACAKQLVAANYNKMLLSTVMNEIEK
jgi:hypothetical protein